MYTSKTQLRIHYALTDQMGVVYYGRYAEFFEIGRVEALRQLGISYKQVEAEGVIMPVTELYVRYVRPARYDDLITIVTTVRTMPEHYKIVFETEIYNEDNLLLTKGNTTLYFWDVKEKKKTPMPESIKKKMERYF